MEIRRICKQAGLTAVYVTHDQKEALSVADRLAVMRDGVIEQTGTPEEVYRAPVSRFVAGFIGEGTFIDGQIEALEERGVRVSTRIGALHAASAPQGVSTGDRVTLCLRPEALSLRPPPDASSDNLLSGHFCESVYLGEVAQHQIGVPSADGAAPCLLTAVELNPVAGRSREGEKASVWVAPEHVIVTPLSMK